MAKNYDKSSIGVVQKIKSTILKEVIISALAGIAGAVGGGADSYKVWVKIPDFEEPLTVETSWKIKVGDSIKIHYCSGNPKKCKIDDDYLMNRVIDDTMKNRTEKKKKS